MPLPYIYAFMCSCFYNAVMGFLVVSSLSFVCCVKVVELCTVTNKFSMFYQVPVIVEFELPDKICFLMIRSHALKNLF